MGNLSYLSYEMSHCKDKTGDNHAISVSIIVTQYIQEESPKKPFLHKCYCKYHKKLKDQINIKCIDNSFIWMLES